MQRNLELGLPLGAIRKRVMERLVGLELGRREGIGG